MQEKGKRKQTFALENLTSELPNSNTEKDSIKKFKINSVCFRRNLALR